MGKKLLQSSTVRRAAKIDSLTSLRFIAAALVFTWHAPIPDANGLHDLQLGYLGVAFFYILSGFILTYVYYRNIVARKSGSIKKFYISRIAKLYPVHVLTFLAALPLTIITIQSVFAEHTKVKAFLAGFFNLTLTQAWIPKSSVYFSFNGVAWSISVEAFFYLLFPIIVLVIYRYRKRFTLRNILLAMSGMWLLCMVLLLPQVSHIDDWVFYIFPLARLPDFLMGIFVALIYMDSNKKKPFGIKLGVTHATIVEVASIVLVISGLFIGTLMPQSVRFSIWMVPSLAFVVLVFSYQKGLVSKLLNNRVLIFLGEASFSFYMVHQLVIRYVLQLGISYWGVVLLSFVLSTVVSGFLYVIYEEPLRLRLKAFFERRLIKL